MFSVVVPTFNRGSVLGVTLESLLAQDADFDCEIVVVDNNSTDETSSVVQAYVKTHPQKLRYVFESQQGSSAARNAGIAASRGEVIAFIDDDVIAQPTWLRTLAETFRAYPHAWCVGGKVTLRLPQDLPPWFDPLPGIMTTYLSLQDLGDRTLRLAYPQGLISANLAVRRTALDQVGLFDTSLGRFGAQLLCGEDVELCRRIQRAGGGVYYCGRAVVEHLVPASRVTKRFLRQRAYWEGRTHGLFARNDQFPRRWSISHSTVTLSKDWAKAVVFYGLRDGRRSLECELAARKQWGFLHELILSRALKSRPRHERRPPTVLSTAQSIDDMARLKALRDPWNGLAAQPDGSILKKPVASGSIMTSGVRWLLQVVAADITREVVSRSCVVIAPHPDDEVLGCGGTIAKKIRSGSPVSVVFLTDGRNGVHAPPLEARALREAEAVSAAAALGLTADRLVFLGFEDGKLHEYLDRATDEVRRHVLAVGADELFVPYRWEHHADHVAAWQIGRASLPSGGRLFEYPIWYGPWLWTRLAWSARLASVAHLADILHAVKVSVADMAGTKRQALAAYRSQVAAFEQHGPWGRTFLAGFMDDHEFFFVRQ